MSENRNDLVVFESFPSNFISNLTDGLLPGSNCEALFLDDILVEEYQAARSKTYSFTRYLFECSSNAREAN
jgi:hypothetical protein